MRSRGHFRICGRQYGTGAMSPFWGLEFGVVFCILFFEISCSYTNLAPLTPLQRLGEPSLKLRYSEEKLKLCSHTGCALIQLCCHTACAVIQVCSHTGVFSYRCVLIQVCSHTGVFSYRCVLIQVFSYRCVLIQVCSNTGVFSYRCVLIKGVFSYRLCCHTGVLS